MPWQAIFLLLMLLPGMLLLPAGPAGAGDAAARRALGFSPDGKVFAVEQYTMLYEEDASFAEYLFVDTRSNSFLPGTPVRVMLRGDSALDETRARAAAANRAAPLLRRLCIDFSSARHVAGSPSMGLDDIGIYQLRSGPLSKALEFSLPDGRHARLALVTHPIAEATCAGYGGRATSAPAMGHGLTLSLQLDQASPLVLQHDERLPRSRRCAEDYGLAEAWLQPLAGGGLALAVLVEYADNEGYHAGPNRRFMVVSGQVPADVSVAPALQ